MSDTTNAEMSGPYTSRRARRCVHGRWCRHGGRIRPGERAVRTRQHTYQHAVWCIDLAAVASDASSAMATAFGQLAVAITDLRVRA